MRTIKKGTSFFILSWLIIFPRIGMCNALSKYLLVNKTNHPAIMQLQTRTAKYSIYKNNQLLFTLSEKAFRQFRDSIALQTKDTLFTSKEGKVIIHPYRGSASVSVNKNNPPMVYTDKKGYVNLRLPNAIYFRYQVRFFDEPNQLLFAVQLPKEDNLILEKSNFIRSGWFDYEVWQNDELKEKGRIFLPK